MKFFTVLFTASFATVALTQAGDDIKLATDFIMMKSPEQYAANAALSRYISNAVSQAIEEKKA